MAHPPGRYFGQSDTAKDMGCMEIRVLGCYGGADANFRLTSFLVNGTFAVDAGAIVNALTFEEQQNITDIYISHIHLDHVNSLPFLFDNIFGMREEPIRVYSHNGVIEHLKNHIFNDICWPDFSVLPTPQRPTVEYIEVPVGKEFKVGNLSVLPVEVNHLVPNAGVVVTENGKSWVYPSDTADTDEIWEVVNGLEDPCLLFLECSFPNRFERLAEESCHLTPAGVELQLSKINRPIPTRVYHCKPSAIKEISAELKKIDYPDLAFLQQDTTYTI